MVVAGCGRRSAGLRAGCAWAAGVFKSAVVKEDGVELAGAGVSTGTGGRKPVRVRDERLPRRSRETRRRWLPGLRLGPRPPRRRKTTTTPLRHSATARVRHFRLSPSLHLRAKPRHQGWERRAPPKTSARSRRSKRQRSCSKPG